jgi:ribosome biogenesis GTPase
MQAETPPGWDAEWAAAAAAADPAGAWTAVRISAEHRGAYQARAGEQVAIVELRGKTYRAAADKRDLPAVGDFSLVSRWDKAIEKGGGSATIEAQLPRRSLLVRRAAGNATMPQPLAANVDLAMIVTSANSDLSAQRLDRYLELVRDGGIAPLVVVSKLDLAEDPAALLAEVEALAPGTPVIGTSVPKQLGFDRIQAAVGRGKTAILIGSSGVGKSTLLNQLMDEASRVVGEVRTRDERGQHTTTARQLFAMSDGTIWIDTPGMRELAAFTEGDPAIAFGDLMEFAATCKFADCQHRNEPGCAVVAAVAAGGLAAGRLASYQKLRDERAKDRDRQTIAARIAETRAGQRAAAAKLAARKR